MQDRVEDIKTLFGHVRSALSTHNAKEVWNVAWRARALDPISYDTQWLPYLRSFLGYENKLMFEVDGFDELHRHLKLLPFIFTHISLSLSDYELGAPQMPELANVIELHLEDCVLKDKGATDLALTSYLINLKVLTLRHNDITPTGFEVLFTSMEFRDLQALVVRYNDVGTDGARVLAKQGMPCLRTLDLMGTQLGDEGMVELLKARFCRRLHSLNVSYNMLTDRWVAPGLATGQFEALTHLDLSRNVLTPDGVCAFLAAASMPCLQELFLSRVHVGNKGARVLARSTLTSGLRRLDLSHSRVGIVGFRHLYAPRVAWEHLEYLSQQVRDSI